MDLGTDDRKTACRTLMAAAGKPHLWGEDGPTNDAIALLEQCGGPLSRAEYTALRAAFDLHEGSGRLMLKELFELNDPRMCVALAGLLVAISLNDIPTWVASIRNDMAGAERMAEAEAAAKTDATDPSEAPA